MTYGSPCSLPEYRRAEAPVKHVWKRPLRMRLFGTKPLLKCACGRWCWMDRKNTTEE